MPQSDARTAAVLDFECLLTCQFGFITWVFNTDAGSTHCGESSVYCKAMCNKIGVYFYVQDKCATETNPRKVIANVHEVMLSAPKKSLSFRRRLDLK